jgi:hypothetical protein
VNALDTVYGAGGRIGAYAWSASLDAKGGRNGVVLKHGTWEDVSTAPPEIRLAFGGGATRVSCTTTTAFGSPEPHP